MWTQIVGKIRLKKMPWIKPSWHVPFYVMARGLSTSPVPHGTRLFESEFDFIHHALLIRTSEGAAHARAENYEGKMKTRPINGIRGEPMLRTSEGVTSSNLRSRWFFSAQVGSLAARGMALSTLEPRLEEASRARPRAPQAPLASSLFSSSKYSKTAWPIQTLSPFWTPAFLSSLARPIFRK